MNRPPHVPDAIRRDRYERIFREVYEPLQHYVLRRAAPSVVDDVVAEALCVLWRRLDEVPDELVLPWCYGVTRRCLANHRRGDTRRQQLVLRLANEPVSVAVSLGNESELTAALGELSADERELVRLWAWEQLQPREIAVVLAISANAASIRLHRAQQHLAEVLAPGRKDSGRPGHEAVGHAKEAR
jgi:RNA polymerase sigma-70 factor (ECF subfamily)